MIIQLDTNWYLEDDGCGFMLYKWTGKMSQQKRGTETKVYDVLKYPGSFESALSLYARLKVCDENEKITLGDYVEKIKEAYADVLKKVELGGKGHGR